MRQIGACLVRLPGPHLPAAQSGGGAFVVVLPEAGRSEVMAAARNMADNVEGAFLLDEQTLQHRGIWHRPGWNISVLVGAAPSTILGPRQVETIGVLLTTYGLPAEPFRRKVLETMLMMDRSTVTAPGHFFADWPVTATTLPVGPITSAIGEGRSRDGGR